jgi:hypothetical protein
VDAALFKIANLHALSGDVTNWMNQTSGAFNYTGLVTNMQMKAGSFYGMSVHGKLRVRLRVKLRR